jgi:hypothetical protein
MRHFRRSWLRACRAAGVPGRLLHDYRRSAARNLSRAGVPERVIMQLCGWKTRSVFDRYRIVAEQDLAEGLAKLSGANTDRRRTVETIAASVRQRELLKGLVAGTESNRRHADFQEGQHPQTKRSQTASISLNVALTGLPRGTSERLGPFGAGWSEASLRQVGAPPGPPEKEHGPACCSEESFLSGRRRRFGDAQVSLAGRRTMSTAIKLRAAGDRRRRGGGRDPERGTGRGAAEPARGAGSTPPGISVKGERASKGSAALGRPPGSSAPRRLVDEQTQLVLPSAQAEDQGGPRGSTAVERMTPTDGWVSGRVAVPVW